MNQLKLCIILCIAFSLFQTSVLGQNQTVVVKKSTEKIVHNGIVYYIHKVQTRETIYSISRAYSVTEQDIANANPNILLETIKVGQVLKIPTHSKVAGTSEGYFGLSKDDFIYHTVQAKETPYFLHSKYNVSLEDIYKYNPGSENGLQIGQQIRIPRKHILTSSATGNANSFENQDNKNLYEVKDGDTLYSLAKTYGVSVAQIIEANKELRWGLKSGQLLRIPSLTDLTLADSTGSKTFLAYSKSSCDSLFKNNQGLKKIKVALLLPFEIEESFKKDTSATDSLKRARPKMQKFYGRKAIEFYEGFLLALDSLQQTGLKIDLFTYSTESDTVATKKIIKDLDYIEPHLIFGPFRTDNVDLISDFATQRGIPHIKPVSKSPSPSGDNPKGFQLIPSGDAEIALCADFISQYHEDNIILIHNEDSIGQIKIDYFKENLYNYFTSKGTYQQAILKELHISDTLKPKILDALSQEKRNIVFIISSKEAYVKSILSIIQVANPIYDILLFGLPEWQNPDNNDIALLHRFNTILYTPFYIDYQTKLTRSFLRNAKKKLGYEPHRIVYGKGFNYAYLGFECGLFFTKAISVYGEGFTNCLSHYNLPLMQSEYNFQKQNVLDEFENHSIRFIQFKEDFTLNIIPFEPSELKVSHPRTVTQSPETKIEDQKSKSSDDVIKGYFDN